MIGPLVSIIHVPRRVYEMSGGIRKKGAWHPSPFLRSDSNVCSVWRAFSKEDLCPSIPGDIILLLRDWIVIDGVTRLLVHLPPCMETY